MVASVIEELSPKDQRSKLLLEKLTFIQEAQVSAVSAGFAAASNLQLLRRDALLKNLGFQPQVLNSVRTVPLEGSHVLGQEPKELHNRVRAICQADRMACSSVTFVQKTKDYKTSMKTTSSSKKSQSRTSVLIVLVLLPLLLDREPWHRSSPFVLALAGDPATDPTQNSAARLRRLLQLPQPEGIDGVPVGAGLTDFAPQWRSLLGHCGATSIVEDGVDLTFQQRPQLTHQCINFQTRSSWQDLQQAVDALLLKGAIERVTNVTSLGHYSRLFLVPKKMGDLHLDHRPFHSQPSLGSSTLRDGNTGIRLCSHQNQEWTVSIDILDAYLHVSMHQAVQKYLRVVVNKKVYQFSWLPFGLATSPREFTKLLRPVVALLRQRGVKLQFYLDNWLIRADTPEQAQLHAQTTIRMLQFLGWIINNEKSDLIPSQDFQFTGMQFNNRQFTVAPLLKMHLKVQSVHQNWMTNPNITACDLHRLLGVLVFMASLAQQGRLRLCPVKWWATSAWCQRTRSWDNWITVPLWVLSEVAWWASPAVLQDIFLATKETEVTFFTDASSSGWGTQLGSSSTQGQWSASQRSWHINILEMQAVIYDVRDFLPHLRWFHLEWFRLMCDNAVTMAYIKNEGGTRSYTLMQMTMRLLNWCDRKAITLVPVHLPGVHNIQMDSLSWVGQTLNAECTMAMECLRPAFAKWSKPQVDLFASFTNKPLIKPSGQMPCRCPGTTGGASCMRCRHSRWSLKFCRRSLSHQASGWFWSLHCNRRLHGFWSWWIWYRKIQSRCSLGVKICWLKTFWSAKVWQKRVPTGRQIYTRGNSTGRPEVKGPFQGSCLHDVNVNGCLFIGIATSEISWIMETDKEAYTQADPEFDQVIAHSVRALSASWAFNCQLALSDILSAAVWRSSGVFQNSYLRDMACIADGMSTLGPVVVAQQVVDPGHLHPPP